MSRSRKRNSISGIADGSEKRDKAIWHRRMRARTREALHREDEIMPDEFECSDPWSMSKDGKQYFDKKKYPELMRK